MLAAIPGGAALAAFGPALGARADDIAPSDLQVIIDNAVAMLAGTADSNASGEAAIILDRIHNQARTRLQQADNAGPGELFAGVPLGQAEQNLTDTLTRLAQIALATQTPGVDSDLVGNDEVISRVLDGVHWVHENYLADTSSGYYGNWYHWEIGMPIQFTRILALLDEHVDPIRLAQYVDTMDDYLRAGTDGDVDLDSRFHTGANLVDITSNRILQGALLDDVARVSKAVSDQATAYATIDPYNLQHGNTDGYYADGSFIQHHTVAYTGSYGRVLLTRVLQTITFLDGTAALDDDLPDIVVGWIRDGFAPVIARGWLMETVKGRAVARTSSGYTDLNAVIEAIVDLSAYADPSDGQALEAYATYLIEFAPPNLSAWVSPVSVVRYAGIVASDHEPAELIRPRRSFAFNAMERNVHRGDGFTFALSRSSERISKYEYMSGENLRPWFSGDGAFHLYLDAQDQTEAFGVNFLVTVSPYRLPGISAPDEQRETIPELYGQAWYENPDHPLEFTSSSESQNAYVYFPLGTNEHSGSAVLDAVGTASMVLTDDVPYVDKQAGILPEDFVAYAGIRGSKSWFFFGDQVVVLAAGVHDPQQRGPVTTTLDSRIADPGDGVQVTGALRDGSAWDGESAARLRWLRWHNPEQDVAVGYRLLDGPPVHVQAEDVSGNLRDVRTNNPNTTVTKHVFTATVQHGPEALAYAIVPNAQESDLDADPVQVVANTARVQAVRRPALGVSAMNTFDDASHTIRLLTVHGPACVVLIEHRNEIEIAVSDPTLARDQIAIDLRGGRPPEVIVADEGIEIDGAAGSSRIVVDTHEAYGRVFTARLRLR